MSPETAETYETPEGHRLVREMLGAHALGHLSAAEEAVVRSHLGTCSSCWHELADIEPVVRALSHITATDLLPGGLRPDLATRLR